MIIFKGKKYKRNESETFNLSKPSDGVTPEPLSLVPMMPEVLQWKSYTLKNSVDIPDSIASVKFTRFQCFETILDKTKPFCSHNLDTC
jgi:hypothetical protein